MFDRVLITRLRIFQYCVDKRKKTDPMKPRLFVCFRGGSLRRFAFVKLVYTNLKRKKMIDEK